MLIPIFVLKTGRLWLTPFFFSMKNRYSSFYYFDMLYAVKSNHLRWWAHHCYNLGVIMLNGFGRRKHLELGNVYLSILF